MKTNLIREMGFTETTMLVQNIEALDLGITVVLVLQNTRGSTLGKEWGLFE